MIAGLNSRFVAKALSNVDLKQVIRNSSKLAPSSPLTMPGEPLPDDPSLPWPFFGDHNLFQGAQAQTETATMSNNESELDSLVFAQAAPVGSSMTASSSMQNRLHNGIQGTDPVELGNHPSQGYMNPPRRSFDNDHPVNPIAMCRICDHYHLVDQDGTRFDTRLEGLMHSSVYDSRRVPISRTNVQSRSHRPHAQMNALMHPQRTVLENLGIPSDSVNASGFR